MHYIAIRGQRVFLFVVGALVCITCYVGFGEEMERGRGGGRDGRTFGGRCYGRLAGRSIRQEIGPLLGREPVVHHHRRARISM